MSIILFRSLVLALFSYIKAIFHSKKKIIPNSIGFLHPYPGAMGGGELVLWIWISKLPLDKMVIIYCTSHQKSILQDAQDRFDVELRKDIKFVVLPDYFDSKLYPVMTLFGQALGMIKFISDCCDLPYLPSEFIDTTGLAFGYSIAAKYNIPITCYVHYPIISTDMIAAVENKVPRYNNSALITKFPMLSHLKLFYYKLYAKWYKQVGQIPKKVLVNSTWTKNHIDTMWETNAKIVYPPCQSKALLNIPLERNSYDIVSVAQFRPEKNHELQLHAFSLVIKKAKKNHLIYLPHLTMIGGCRNASDERRVSDLKALAAELQIEKYVDFLINAPYAVLLRKLQESDIGLHTMVNEHFGIGIIEYMFSGCIAVANDSGGPKLDIIKDGLGHLASTKEQYGEILYSILYETSSTEKQKIREKARESAIDRFSLFDIQ